EEEALVQDPRIAAEALLPERPRQDDHVAVTALVLRRREGATELGTDAEDVEEVRADHADTQSRRLAGTRERQRTARAGRSAGKYVRQLCKVQVVRRRECVDGRVPIERGAHAHQLLRVRERQRTEENAVDDAEDRAVRADSQCEREQRSEGEAWSAGELPNRVAQVCDQCVHTWPGENQAGRPAGAPRSATPRRGRGG